MHSFLRSWKTSLIGILGSSLHAYMGGASWKSVVAAIPILLMGLFAKDADKTNSPHPTAASTVK